MATFLDRADLLAARGLIDEALALIDGGVGKDDPDALYCLAIWHLVGVNVPRDLKRARDLLRRAAIRGHAEAALIEVALVANGSGDTADWRLARQRLSEAAVSSPIAQRQLHMLNAMPIDDDGNPLAFPPHTQLCEMPTVHIFPALLSPPECAHLAMAARDLLEPTTVFDSTTGQMVRHPVRTSSGAVIGPTREDLVIQAINRRIAMISGSRVEQGESLSILHYAPGEQYRPHFDFVAGSQNQRVKTIIVYLNHGYAGGATQFLANGATFKGNVGDAILFDNVDDAGARYVMSQHAGLPVVSGTKWVATRWIRQTDFNPWVNGGQS
jgi:prolyl 4-hydroxylase